MIQTFEDLPERSLPDHLQDLVAIGNMVVKDLHTHIVYGRRVVS